MSIFFNLRRAFFYAFVCSLCASFSLSAVTLSYKTFIGNGDFVAPRGLTLDSSGGGIYVSDRSANTIFKYTSAASGTSVLDTGFSTDGKLTSGELGGITFSQLEAVEFASGFIYTTDLNGSTVYKIAADGNSGSSFHTVVGDDPTDIIVIPGTNDFLGVEGSNVRRINSSGSTVATLVTDLGANSTTKGQMALSGTSLYLARSGGDAVDVFTVDLSGSPTSTNAVVQTFSANLNDTVSGVDVDSSGFVYVSERGVENDIHVFDSLGNSEFIFDGADGDLTAGGMDIVNPFQLLVDEANSLLYVVAQGGTGGDPGIHVFDIQTAVVPEPETYALMLSFLGLAAAVKSRRSVVSKA